MTYDTTKSNEEDEGKQRLKTILVVIAVVIAIGLAIMAVVKTQQSTQPHVVGTLGADGKIRYNPGQGPGGTSAVPAGAPAGTAEAPDPNLSPSKQ